MFELPSFLSMDISIAINNSLSLRKQSSVACGKVIDSNAGLRYSVYISIPVPQR